jgi:hypothetical protein
MESPNTNGAATNAGRHAPPTTGADAGLSPGGAPSPTHTVLVPSNDAYMFGQLMNVATEAVRQASDAAVQKAEVEKQTASLGVRKAEILAKRDEHAVTKDAEHALRREGTVRWLGGIGLVGTFGFLAAALFMGKINDPVAVLPTLATVLVTVMLISERVKKKRDTKATSDDEENE